MLRPEQEDALGMAGDRLRSLYNPGASLEPLRGAMRSSVNRKYAALPGALAAKTMAHGGRSGAFGAGLVEGELSRLGELGSVDTSVAQMGLQQQAQADSLLMQLLGQNFGMQTSGSRSGSSEGSGMGVSPGDPLAGGFQGGVSALMTMLGLGGFGGGAGGVAAGSANSTDVSPIFRFLRRG